MATAQEAYDELVQSLAPEYEHIWILLRLKSGAFHPDDGRQVQEAGRNGFQIASTVGQPNGPVVVFLTRRNQ